MGNLQGTAPGGRRLSRDLKHSGQIFKNFTYSCHCLLVILTLLAVIVVLVAQRPVPALNVLGKVAVLFGFAVEEGKVTFRS